ncbi:MAG: glycoside hydrolase family 31 protein [Oscillospiraceae bacterium]|nr:glycoside hydrolase family 31 protein [Oscillospiraceae bacterium]
MHSKSPQTNQFTSQAAAGDTPQGQAQLSLAIEAGEYWYGLAAAWGLQFPLHAGSECAFSIDPNLTNNQAAGFLLSSAGRYICCQDGFELNVHQGILTAGSRKARLYCGQGQARNLRGAYLAARAQAFAPNGQQPPSLFFTQPQYNSWIELMYDQNQAAILNYAAQIRAHHYPAGILMIDDGWAEDYGNWQFHRGRFPAPRQMVEQLHEAGFKVMLWVCPFISADSLTFREAQAAGILLRDRKGDIAIRPWWNGYSAVLDLSLPAARDWLARQLDQLMLDYGVDGFKFDAGDSEFYRDDDQSNARLDANGQCRQWALFAENYVYNELRACFDARGRALVQRLADRNHSWTGSGLGSLIPNSLAQGILGYPFSCPDMIGGGQYESFLADRFTLDQELFVRYAQCASLMPMMQLSAAPWRVLDQAGAARCLAAVKLHARMAGEILKLAQAAAVTGEPIIRYLAYVFPDQGLEAVTDQFMLGDRLLVAPVLEAGATVRAVRLPQGRWRDWHGQSVTGGQTLDVAVTLDDLPYFERL